MNASLDTGVHWSRRGACATEDPDLCYPVGRSKTLEAGVNRAKAVCRRCPSDVKAACLADALAEKPSRRDVGKVAGERWFPRPTQKAGEVDAS